LVTISPDFPSQKCLFEQIFRQNEQQGGPGCYLSHKFLPVVYRLTVNARKQTWKNGDPLQEKIPVFRPNFLVDFSPKRTTG
jgi:hypothetical protein